VQNEARRCTPFGDAAKDQENDLVKKFTLTLLAAASLAAAIPAAASAQQAWQNINQRQHVLFQRIDVGVMRGDLTRAEAARLKSEFNGIVRLEANYRATGGLSLAERRDLDRRFDQLSARIRFERNDRQVQGPGIWQSINQRQANLDRRIDAALRDRRISPREAHSLRREFQAIARLESQYRSSAPGLTVRERTDLDRRFDQLSARIQIEQRDNNRYGQGYGQGYNR